MRRILALLLLWASPALAVDPVNDVGPKGVPHIFWIEAGRDSSFFPHDFDFNADGKIDMAQITAIGYKVQSGANDFLYFYAEGRTPPGPFQLELPSGSIDAWSQRCRLITEAIGKADSTIIRYDNNNGLRTPLYVWGS